MSVPITPPRVSVVMSVRNAERFVAQAVKSILAQTMSDLEFIVVDNASSDRTPDILSTFARGDARLRIHRHNADLGLATALNFACERAQGPLIARMDGDDIAMPGRLARQAAYLADHHSVGLVGGAAIVIDDTGKGHHALRPPTGDSDIRASLVERNCIIHSTVMMRQDALCRVGGYRAGFTHAEDYDLWLRLAERYQLVQGWMYHGDLIATLAVMLSGRRRQTQLAWNLQCSRMDTRHYRRQLRVVIRACAAVSRRADVVISNSEAGLTGHIALGYRPNRARVIYPGIDTERFRPDRESARSVREELGLPAGAPVVAHIARLDPKKDHACLLKAMERLPAVHVLAIGLGTETLPGVPALHRLGQRADVERLLTACDVSVSSSAFGEGFPNSLAESMAVGVPVAATDVGDTCTIVGDTGHLVPPGSPGQLADAIRHLLHESPDARQARGARARARVVTHFGRPRMVDRFTELYEELVGATS